MELATLVWKLLICRIWINALSIPRGKKKRKLSARMLRVKTLNQRISRINQHSSNKGVCDGRIELDSHADAFVAGRNCLVMHYAERICDVIPCSEEHEPKSNTPIAQVATGYTTSCGKRYILIFNEALCMPEL